MKKCLILDFDDTLVKTIDVHANSWKLALERVLDTDVPIETILADINYGMDVLLQKYQLTTKECLLAQEYKKEIFSKIVHETEVNELLLYIVKNNIFDTVVIASNSSRENVDKIMAYHGIDQSLFNLILTRDDVSMKKPNTEMGNIIFKEFPQYEKDDYLMVGDSEVDKMFARKLDIECILVKS